MAICTLIAIVISAVNAVTNVATSFEAKSAKKRMQKLKILQIVPDKAFGKTQKHISSTMKFTIIKKEKIGMRDYIQKRIMDSG